MCGGKRKGAFVEPAVLTNTTPEMRVNCAEIFAPVVTVEPYDDFHEAVRQVNNSDYGLQAGVITRDAGLIQMAFEELEVGGVIVGDVPSFRVDQMPYGGIKDSGSGPRGFALFHRRHDRAQAAGHGLALNSCRCQRERRMPCPPHS